MSGRDCTSDMLQLDVRHLHRAGLLNPGRYVLQWKRGSDVLASIDLTTLADCVRFTYRHNSDGGAQWQDTHALARLQRTPCHLGGYRAWWLCPRCGRRVAILYAGETPACRHCYRLAYPSERESPTGRAIRKADKIRERLGWEPGILNGSGGKPKGMHWRTFAQLQGQHDAHVNTSFTRLALALRQRTKGR